MAKGGYLGGSTIIRQDKDLDWFGAGSEEDPAYRAAVEKYEAAKAVFHKIRAERPVGAKPKSQQARDYKRRYDAAFEAMEAARPKPRAAQQRQGLSPEVEQRIANLKRDLAMYEKQARQALASHEDHRQELAKLLAAHGIPDSTYPETRKLEL